MDPGAVIPVPDRVRDDGSGTGVTAAEKHRTALGQIRGPAFFRHSGFDWSLPRTPDQVRGRPDPGESIFVRPYSVIPDLIRNPFLSERDGGRISGKFKKATARSQQTQRTAKRCFLGPPRPAFRTTEGAQPPYRAPSKFQISNFQFRVSSFEFHLYCCLISFLSNLPTEVLAMLSTICTRSGMPYLGMVPSAT